MPLLQLQNITLSYSAAPLLKGADLQIDAGERICLVGRNGAGKTTLMRLITGEETAQEGEITRPSGLTNCALKASQRGQGLQVSSLFGCATAGLGAAQANACASSRQVAAQACRIGSGAKCLGIRLKSSST